MQGSNLTLVWWLLAAVAPIPAAAGDGLARSRGRALADCAVLRSHGGPSDNAALRWNELPPGATEIDVVVHLHGFARHGRPLDLGTKEQSSGCDLTAPRGAAPRGATYRRRPTLGIVPRGFRTGGVTGGGSVDVYDFPALTVAASGLDQLIGCGLDFLANTDGGPAVEPLERGRLILTAHSGGGARLLQLLGWHDPDEVELFDALYQEPDAAVDWARRHIRRDAAALSSLPRDRWRDHMASDGGSLRAIFLENSLTLPHNTALHVAIECELRAIPDPEIPAFLRRYYRVERTRVRHDDIPKTFGWQLLADAGADLIPTPASLGGPTGAATEGCPDIDDPH